jgi:hypothetical protein
MNASNVQYLIDLVNYIDELERERGQLHADMKLAISQLQVRLFISECIRLSNHFVTSLTLHRSTRPLRTEVV